MTELYLTNKTKALMGIKSEDYSQFLPVIKDMIALIDRLPNFANSRDLMSDDVNKLIDYQYKLDDLYDIITQSDPIYDDAAKVTVANKVMTFAQRLQMSFDEYKAQLENLAKVIQEPTS